MLTGPLVLAKILIKMINPDITHANLLHGISNYCDDNKKDKLISKYLLHVCGAVVVWHCFNCGYNIKQLVLAPSSIESF